MNIFMNQTTDNTIPLLTDIIAAPAAAETPAPTVIQLQQIRQEIQEDLMQMLLVQVDDMADILKTRMRASVEQALAETLTQKTAQPENIRLERESLTEL